MRYWRDYPSAVSGSVVIDRGRLFRGRPGGQDKRPASLLAVCGWFVAAFLYGTAGRQPYHLPVFFIFSIFCGLAIAQ